MTSDNRTYYQILGVSEDADFEEIRAAFRQKAREYHPDRNQSPDAVERMQEVNEAYEVLRDTDQRAAYDRAHQTIRVSAEHLARAKNIAARALGQMAFDVGSALGSTMFAFPNFRQGIKRRNGIPDDINQLEDIPVGVWHAMYEVALESALMASSESEIRAAVFDAARRAMAVESVRLSYRHALSERSETFTGSFAVDIAVNLLGSLAAVIGFALARQGIQESLPTAAWNQADEAIRHSVSRSIQLRGGTVTPQMLRRKSFIDSVVDNATQEANRVLRPQSQAIGRRVGRAPTRAPTTAPSADLSGVAGVGCLLFFVLPPLYFVLILLVRFFGL